MIDYSHIPIWLRCTNRHLIDPTWKEAQIGREMPNLDLSRTNNKNHAILSDEAKRVIAYIDEQGETCTTDLREVLGVTGARVKQVINNIAGHRPIYEWNNGEEIVYGLLEVPNA